MICNLAYIKLEWNKLDVMRLYSMYGDNWIWRHFRWLAVEWDNGMKWTITITLNVHAAARTILSFPYDWWSWFLGQTRSGLHPWRNVICLHSNLTSIMSHVGTHVELLWSQNDIIEIKNTAKKEKKNSFFLSMHMWWLFYFSHYGYGHTRTLCNQFIIKVCCCSPAFCWT